MPGKQAKVIFLRSQRKLQAKALHGTPWRGAGWGFRQLRAAAANAARACSRRRDTPGWGIERVVEGRRAHEQHHAIHMSTLQGP